MKEKALAAVRIAAKRKSKRLYLGFMDLTAIPDEVFELSHLEDLDLWGNPLEVIPDRLLELPRLRVLELGGLKAPIDRLPAGINLKLDLKLHQQFRKSVQPERVVGITLNSALDRLPSELVELPNLTSLRVFGSAGRVELKGLSQLQSVTDLHLGLECAPYFLELGALEALSCRFTDNGPDLLAELPQLRKLRLDNDSKTRAIAPPWLWTSAKLKALSVRGIAVTEIPEAFENSKIEELSVVRAGLNTLPKQVSRLRNLTSLNLSGNAIGVLPEFLFSLHKLTSLWLANCGLQQIPSSIAELTKLQALSLHSNNLDDLPQEFERLVDLDLLVISSNRFRVVPRVLLELRRLVDLDLGSPTYAGKNGTLVEIPPEIMNLPELVRLDVDNQPIAKPPAEIVANGLSAIQDYYRQLDTAGVDYLCEAKLIVIGEPGAGKTTLTHKLRDADYALDTMEPSTKGINVEDWVYSTHIDVQSDGGRRTVARDFGCTCGTSVDRRSITRPTSSS